MLSRRLSLLFVGALTAFAQARTQLDLDSFEKVDLALANVAAVRDAVGPNVGIGVDFHGRVHRPLAKQLAKALDPLGLLFIEEPLLSENPDGLAQIAVYRFERR